MFDEKAFTAEIAENAEKKFPVFLSLTGPAGNTGQFRKKRIVNKFRE